MLNESMHLNSFMRRSNSNEKKVDFKDFHIKSQSFSKTHPKSSLKHFSIDSKR